MKKCLLLASIFLFSSCALLEGVSDYYFGKNNKNVSKNRKIETSTEWKRNYEIPVETRRKTESKNSGFKKIVLISFFIIFILKFRIIPRLFSIISKLIQINLGGEDVLNRILKQYDKNNQRILKNLYVPYGKEGKTTEIDSIMIRQSGIFVFESKDYSGCISGDSRNKYWIKTFYSRHHINGEYRFYNPIMQNQTHISVLRSFLNEPSIPMFNIVVFSDCCSFKNLIISDDENVVKMREVINKIDRIEYICSDIKINEYKMNEIYQKLLICANPSTEIIQRHLMDVKKLKETVRTNKE